jgi:hypothetical protein
MIDIWTKVNNIGFYSACENRALNCETARRDLYTFYTRVYCEFIVIVENIGSAEGTFSTASILLKEMRYLVYIRYLWLYI